MAVRKLMVAGNWKMNVSFDGSVALARALRTAYETDIDYDCVVFPSFPCLAAVAEHIVNSPIALGAQTVSEHPQGAFTGQVSAKMLSDVGCSYVLVGHSERRHGLDESNHCVAQQSVRAIEQGLSPIVCLGETLAERQVGLTLEIIKEQLAVVLSLQDNATQLMSACFAYEPVWAIGSGQVATPEQAQEVHVFIRDQLTQANAELGENARILYGGSVKPDNAASLIDMPDIDGFLVGGASLDAQQFIAIGESCNSY